MAATATSRLRLIKQGTYDNPETWGVELNNGALDMVDEAFGGSSFAVSGNVTLTVENYTEDQARSLFLIMSGAGGFTVTVPAIDKLYLLVNNCAADVTVTPLAGTGAVVRAGTAVWWYCDGTDGFVVDPTLDKIKPPAAAVAMNGQKLTGMGAGTDPTDGATLSNRLDQFAAPTAAVALNTQKITGLGDPTNAQDAATKNYIDTLAASGNLGTVAGIAGEVVIVAGIASQVQTVADDTAALNTVSVNIANVGAVADNIAAIINAAANFQPLDPATAKTDEDQSWTGAQRSGTGTTLTSATTITPTLANWEGNRAALTLGHNATLANPTDIASMVGYVGRIVGAQDATGGRTLAVGSYWYPTGSDTMPDVPAGANDKFRIDFEVASATRIDFTLSSVGV